MSQRSMTTKTIAVSELDPETRQLVRDAGEGKIHLTIVDNGDPVAAIMPLQMAREWEAERQRFFDTLRDMQAAANLTPEEAEALAREAVEAARSQIRVQCLQF